MSLLFDAVGESLKRAGTIAAKDLDKGVQVTSKKLGAKADKKRRGDKTLELRCRFLRISISTKKSGGGAAVA
jgi:hypothetical protein